MNKKSGKSFNAKSNDIWCLGVCLWVMIFGGLPWDIAINYDQSFKCIINGYIIQLLSHWNKINYVDNELINLFEGIFKFEQDRMTLDEIKKCSWLKG